MIWATIPGFSRYQISDQGSIRIAATLKPMKPRIDDQGYLAISLIGDNGERKKSRVSRFMLTAFVGLPAENMHAAHLDGNKAHNCLANLAWETPQQNEADKRRHGTVAIGARHGMSKLDDAKATEIRKRYALVRPHVTNCIELAKEFGVSRSTVQAIANGKEWTHLAAPARRVVAIRRTING